MAKVGCSVHRVAGSEGLQPADCALVAAWAGVETLEHALDLDKRHTAAAGGSGAAGGGGGVTRKNSLEIRIAALKAGGGGGGGGGIK